MTTMWRDSIPFVSEMGCKAYEGWRKKKSPPPLTSMFYNALSVGIELNWFLTKQKKKKVRLIFNSCYAQSVRVVKWIAFPFFKIWFYKAVDSNKAMIIIWHIIIWLIREYVLNYTVKKDKYFLMCETIIYDEQKYTLTPPE